MFCLPKTAWPPTLPILAPRPNGCRAFCFVNCRSLFDLTNFIELWQVRMNPAIELTPKKEYSVLDINDE